LLLWTGKRFQDKNFINRGAESYGNPALFLDKPTGKLQCPKKKIVSKVLS